MLALRGWQREEINGNEYELNSIITEKWEGKAYRLVIQRERRMGGELDLWEGGYTYRCILTNDYTSTTREIWETCKASNVQLVFYRGKKSSDEILVKCLLNGDEAKLPVPIFFIFNKFCQILYSV